MTKKKAKKAKQTPGVSRPTPASPMLVAQLFTLRDHLKTPADAAKTFKRVAKIGYPAVQVSGIKAIEPMEIKALLNEAGLLAVGAHIQLSEMESDLDAVIDRLHAWDCNYVAIPCLDHSLYNTAAAWRKLAKSWNKIGKALDAEGITLQYHNHCFEFQRYSGKTALEIIYENTDPNYLQAELDLHWIARGGANPVNWIQAMRGRMDQVHLKDLAILDNVPVTAEVGHGNLDWNAIFPALKKARVKYYLVEQDQCPVTKDPFKSLTMSYKFITKALGR